jgi:hypothetical protein
VRRSFFLLGFCGLSNLGFIDNINIDQINLGLRSCGDSNLLNCFKAVLKVLWIICKKDDAVVAVNAFPPKMFIINN